MRHQPLELRGEDDRPVRQLADIERLHAQPVAGEEQGVLIGIVEREGEHAVEPGEAVRPPLPPGGEDDFGVALGLEMVALDLQLGANLAEIVDLAIIGDDQPAIGGQHRLRRGLGKIDDREAAMAEADARRGPHAAAVRSTMDERVGHRLDPCRIDRLGHVGVEDAGDAAHGQAPPAARSANGATGPRAARKASIAGRALTPRAGAGADTSTATARCGPPNRRVFIVSSFTLAPLPVRIVPTR